MSYSVTYDSKNHLILIVHKGVVDKSVLNKSRSEAARLAKQYNCFNILADLREATSGISTIDIFKLPQTTSEQLFAAGLNISQFKRALVVAQEFGDPAFFEAVSTNRGQNVKLFRNLEKAKKWLFGD